MRPGDILLIVAVAAGPSAVCLAILAAIGAASSGAAVAATVAVIIVAFGVALFVSYDMSLLSGVVRRAAEEDPAPTELPLLAPLQDVAREVDRLGRALAARGATLAQVRDADSAIAERLPDPLILLGRDRSVRRANAAARAAYGADLPAVLRQPQLRAALDRALATPGGSASAEVTLRVPVLRDVRATVVALNRPLPDGSLLMLTLSDRSRERAIERTRADFVANASHELRTPLASLIGFIETLRGPAADDAPAQQRFLGIMAEQAERMNRLVDDLLSLSRIELTEHQPPIEPVALDELLPRMAAGFEPHVALRRITLQVDVAPDLPLVAGDEDQLAQVVQNLLDNAVKYGRDTGTVLLSATRPQAGGNWPSRPGVLVTVRDDGPGIAREHLPRLTERFYRVDKGRSRTVGGTGLGLAIVKHIINRHRGQMLIESDEGLGTTITLWLPAQVEAARTPAPAEAPSV
jgi:two-component system, OmpR family, phosphate regulon sensor histidine kinase PhoR